MTFISSESICMYVYLFIYILNDFLTFSNPSSTVMNFDYKGLRVNILDTPGHQDFSEDTYRALAAGKNCSICLRFMGFE